jgi:hypothetical protein
MTDGDKNLVRSKLAAIFNARIEQNRIDIPKAIKKVTPLMVKIDGQFFITPKGKMVWNSVGSAKNAIRAHILDNYSYVMYTMKVDYKFVREEVERYYQDLLDNRVEFEYI